MPQTLTLDLIEYCTEIQNWLDQFPTHRRTQAISLLLQLRFVTRDEYAEWLKTTILKLSNAVCGLYSVRKFDETVTCIWDDEGTTLARPAKSLGSEDLVQSVISGLIRANPNAYLDHPSISEIKSRKQFHAVLIDDTIGSGDRLASYLRRMFSHKTFISRWSFGCIRLHIVTYTRSTDARSTMLDAIPGSDHGVRIYPRSRKVFFYSQWAFDASNLDARWGKSSTAILDLCDSVKSVPKNRRRGYGGTMANIVFFHSVPNNLPGMLWFQNQKWNALFPNRSFPQWLPSLLATNSQSKADTAIKQLPTSLRNLLYWIKRGRSKNMALSQATGYDIEVIRTLLEKARIAGFINKNNRLTIAGSKVLMENNANSSVVDFDRSLYVPSNWCADSGTVQPS